MIYELLYILSGSFTDAEIDGEKETVQKLLEKEGAELKSNKTLAKLPLAYPIKKMKHGTYVLAYFTAPAENMQKLSRELELHDPVLRHLILEVKESEMEKERAFGAYQYPLAQSSKDKPRRKPTDKPEAAPAVAPPTPAVKEEKMSVEEIDQKIDAILEKDPDLS